MREEILSKWHLESEISYKRHLQTKRRKRDKNEYKIRKIKEFKEL